MKKTLVIAAAGTGSRLAKYTQYYNKAMCTLGPKPVISYIIEKFTKEDEIFILLGYKGDLLKQVVKICYPDWNIRFVYVDKFEGPGSGPGYSLYCARDFLNKPFIYWSNDTLIGEDINDFDYSTNWVMVSDFQKENAFEYRHAEVCDDGITLKRVHEKNEYEENGRYFPSIELCYIKDYEQFWEGAEQHYEEFVKVGVNCGMNYLNENHPISTIINKTNSWTDTGKTYLFEKYNKEYIAKMEENVLEKEDEFIWFFDDKIVKFHLNPDFISGRIERHQILSKLIEGSAFKLPQIISYDTNVYSYKKEPGRLVSDIVTPKMFERLIENWFKNIPRIDDPELAESVYMNFYKKKTVSRVKTSCRMHNLTDEEIMINDVPCKPVMDLLDKIDWEKISKFGILSKKVHGDFHLDNILYNDKEDKFVLLDWRQRFGDSVICDSMYDLGKLFMAFTVSYEAALKNLYKIEHPAENKVYVDIFAKLVYSRCKEILEKFILDHYGEQTLIHAKFIHILIVFGSSGCHPNDYGEFLFYLGKYMLNEFYVNHKEYFI